MATKTIVSKTMLPLNRSSHEHTIVKHVTNFFVPHQFISKDVIYMKQYLLFSNLINFASFMKIGIMDFYLYKQDIFFVFILNLIYYIIFFHSSSSSYFISAFVWRGAGPP